MFGVWRSSLVFGVWRLAFVFLFPGTSAFVVCYLASKMIFPPCDSSSLLWPTQIMKTVPLGSSDLIASRLAYGCWRIADRPGAGDNDAKVGRQAVITAFEAGYTLFDLADIYGGGDSERVFGQVLKDLPTLRRQILIVTKCGIRKPGIPMPDAPYRYDFSRDYLLQSCEASLQRLGIETIDIFLLHRPDYLMNPTEVADAFSQLKAAGKVRHFGVSNFRPSQFTALQSACPMRLLVNQVEISLARLACFEDGTLDQCLAEGVTPMAWSPLAGGKLGDGPRKVLPSQEAYRTESVNRLLDELAASSQSTRVALALAWLMTHPAGIVPVVGSTDAGRIREAAQADTIALTREDWYRLLVAARGEFLP
jgi:predicted oxidoreductase